MRSKSRGQRSISSNRRHLEACSPGTCYEQELLPYLARLSPYGLIWYWYALRLMENWWDWEALVALHTLGLEQSDLMEPEYLPLHEDQMVLIEMFKLDLNVTDECHSRLSRCGMEAERQAREKVDGPRIRKGGF